MATSQVGAIGIAGIEGIAEVGECAGVIRSEGAEEVEGLFRLHESEADVAVIEHLNQIVGGGRIGFGGRLLSRRRGQKMRRAAGPGQRL